MDLVISMQYFPQGIILPKPITVKNYHANNVIDVLNVWNINILFGKMYLVCWENFTRINLISILSGLFVQHFYMKQVVYRATFINLRFWCLFNWFLEKLLGYNGNMTFSLDLFQYSYHWNIKYKKPGAETTEMHIHIQPIL